MIDEPRSDQARPTTEDGLVEEVGQPLVDPLVEVSASVVERTDDLVVDHEGAALALDFAAVARELYEQPSTVLTLQRLVELAVEMVDTCQHAGVAVLRGGTLTTTAATDDTARMVDEVQQDSRQGPCIDALRDRAVYRTDDLLVDKRWPLLAERMRGTGVRSLLSFRLFTDSSTLGSLTLSSSQVSAFDDGAFATGAILASHATIAFANARDADAARTLERAVDSNRTIGVAIGILMATLRIDEAAALDLLKGASSHTNRKLFEVASDVVRTGMLLHEG